MPTLLRDAYLVLERYGAPAFIRLARTAEPLATHEQTVCSVQACRSALQALDPSELGILLDWRLAPPMLEPGSLEQAILSDAETLAGPFSRRAVLLLSAAPAERTSQAWSSANVQAFYDEEAAIAYVSA